MEETLNSILKGMRAIYKQNQELLSLLRPTPPVDLEEIAQSFGGTLIPEQENESQARKLARQGLNKT